MDIKEQDILGDNVAGHWYYRAKGAAMRKLVGPAAPNHVLDVGAGSGFFSRMLLERGAAEATCVDPGYAEEQTETHAGRPIHFLRSVGAGDYDLLLLMDVLEHVDDDVGLLREYSDLAPAGARFLVSVPAFNWLWSGHDVFLEHRRRYTLPEAENVVARAGLNLVHGCYYYGLLLPLAAGSRLVGRLSSGPKGAAKSDLRVHAPITNAALGAVCAAELSVFRANRLAGLSVFCLAEKPAQA
jgi:SAM-dependent methyltransferase